MATVVSSIISPEIDTVKAHLAILFAPCAEHYPDGMIEIAYGQDGPNQAQHFGITKKGLEEAAAYAVGRNKEGQNVYVGVNPRKPTTPRGKRAGADCIEIAFWQFADFDEQEAVQKLASGDLPIKPTYTVTTGTTPFKRPHFYWRLEEPVGNLEEWTKRQKGIADSLGGDHVIDPPRIMRIAGLVNYPPQHKLKRGYKVEVVTLKTEFSSERPDVLPEQIAAAYPCKNHTVDAHGMLDPQAANTLAAMSPGTKIENLIAACQSGQEWHNNMVRLTATQASRGRTNAEIMGLAHAITLPGYSIADTQREMATALHGARTKYDLPEPEEQTVEEEEAGREPADSVFELLDMDTLENLPPPTWLIDGLITDYGLTVLYGDPGAGKSFVALDMSLRIAFGMDWHGDKVTQSGVLYVAGEGARGLGGRVRGWRKEHALEGADAPFTLLPVAVQLLDDKERSKLIRTIDAAITKADHPIGLIVIDTVSRAIAGGDENGQETMSMFVKACDDIKQHCGGAVMAVHHAGKDKERGMRGSTVLLGGCDASIKVEKSEQIVTISTEKQKDGEEAAPIYLTAKKIEWPMGLEMQSTLVLTKSSKPLLNERDLSRMAVQEIFELVDRRWNEGSPLSPYPHAKRAGRYIVDHICKTYDVSAKTAEHYVEDWQLNGMMRTEETRKGGPKGLHVLEHFVAAE